MSDSTNPTSEESSEWLVHSCPHCDGPFKSRVDDNATQMACPHCGEIVQLRMADQEAENAFEATDEKVGEAANVGSDSDADAAHAAAETGENEIGEEIETLPEGEIRKKRRKPLKEYNLDWDAEGKPKSDEDDDDDIREYYEVDPDDPEAVRIRRVRRKKNLTGTQKLVRYSVIGSVTAVLVGTGVMGSMMWFQSVKHATKDTSGEGEIPISIQKLIDEAIGPDAISSIVTFEEQAACEAIINGFEEAESLEEKLSFVRSSDRVKSILTEQYDGKSHSPDLVKEVLRTDKLIDKDRYIVTLAAEMTPSQKIRFFAFEQNKDGILMDWEVSYGYQPMPLHDFMEKQPTEAVSFRVKATLSELMGEGFTEPEDKYQAVLLTYPGNLEFQLRGHMEKTHPWAAMLIARMEFEAPSLILQLRYPSGANSKEDVEIVGIELDSWFY